MRARPLGSTVVLTLSVCLAVAAHREVSARLAQPADQPFAPVLTGLGTLHHEITTASPDAQRFFDQGLRLLYAFNHMEALRAFKEAARLDPACAMAYWGQALTLGPNINDPVTPEREAEAFDAIQKARSLAGRATEAERGYIEALALRHAKGGSEDRSARDAAYAEAMKALAARYPEDPDASTLYASAVMNTMPWDYWAEDGSPRPGTQSVIDTLERVIAAYPDHPGALHYHIHIVEASDDPDRAVPSADRLGGLMPAAGHLVHMPAHIYIRVGRYADASAATERAMLADEDYIAQCRAQGLYPVGYYPHNVHFLWAAATLEGRREVALDAARKVAEKMPHHVKAPWNFDFPAVPLYAYVRFGEWKEIFSFPKPPAEQVYLTAMWHYARGLAQLAEGRIDSAVRELAELDRIKTDTVFTTSLAETPLPTNVEIASRIVAGEVAAKQGDVDRAVTLLREAVVLQDGQAYNEPPNWHQPVRQVLGAVLLEAGRVAEAEAVYRADLERVRENGWSLYGLMVALRQQGKAEDARSVEQRFRTAWARADALLSGSRILSPATSH